MKIWFNKSFSSIAFLLEALQKNTAVTTLFSHIRAVDYQKFADSFIYEPQKPVDYVGFCLEVCQQHQVDVFYPWRHFSQLYPYKQQFADLGVEVIFPCSDKNFELIDNKAAFYQHLLSKKTQVNIPLFATANNKEEFINQYQELRNKTSKLCMKPTVSIYAEGFKVIHDEPDYNAWEALLSGKDKYAIAYNDLINILPPLLPKEMMLLDFLPGNEYSHDVLCRAGKIIAGTIREKISAHDKYQSLVQNAEIERMSALLVQEFDLSGFINLQYRDHANGMPFLLEINPRISGGFPKIMLSGIDYVDLFVKMLTQQPISAAEIKQQYGVKVSDELRYVISQEASELIA